MTRRPNEEAPIPVVPDSYVPVGGIRQPVQSGQTWGSIAASLLMDPWDLIEFNFPGIKQVRVANVQKATRQINWYLREYVGCVTSTDNENWAFTSGLTKGRGGWRGGFIYIPPAIPSKISPIPVHRCSPTGGSMRRPTFYRQLNQRELSLVQRVFGTTLPHWTAIGIGDGLGFDGRPWTDTGPTNYPQIPHMNFQINMGDAASEDLTSTAHLNCSVIRGDGTLAGTLIHEMTHVWQYHNDRSRYGVWVSSVNGSYTFTPGQAWNEYDVEQQASLVERWYENGAKPTDPLYGYIRLVIRSGRLDYPRDLTLTQLNRDVADLRVRGLD